MTRKCKVCRTSFEASMPMQRVCGIECAIKLSQSARAIAQKKLKTIEAKADKATRDKLKSKAQWAREAQAAFNEWVRERDEGSPCISCGRHHEGQYHAGHYLSVGARPELRFEPLNVWRQCAPCNTYLSGNAVLFRKALVEKIGLDRVEWLEGPHEQRKYTVEDLMAIKVEYKAKTKQLKDSK